MVANAPSFLAKFFPQALESNRQAMREALLASLHDTPNVDVRFNTNVSDVVPSADGSGAATLLGGDGAPLADYDVVLDTSGVSSSLRRRRVVTSDLADAYTGFTMLHGVVPNPDKSCASEVCLPFLDLSALHPSDTVRNASGGTAPRGGHVVCVGRRGGPFWCSRHVLAAVWSPHG